MTVEKPPIVWAGANGGNFARGRTAPTGATISPEAWVVHIAQGTFAGIASWFNDVRAGVSAHYSIAKDGRIQQHVDESHTAFANGIIQTGYTATLIDENTLADGTHLNPNLWSISCEHEGNTGEEPTPAMFASSTWLCAWVFQERLFKSGATGVAVDRKHVIKHGEISPIDRLQCPGWTDLFLQTYIARVKVLLQPAAVPLPAPVDPKIRQAMDDLSAAALGLDDLSTRAALQAQSARAAVARLARG